MFLPTEITLFFPAEAFILEFFVVVCLYCCTVCIRMYVLDMRKRKSKRRKERKAVYCIQKYVQCIGDGFERIRIILFS